MTQWVVKLSKLCNLRCQYCYEFEQLSDPARMSHGQLSTLFDHVAAHAAATGETQQFVWHGGEPLALPASYYYTLFQLQKNAFAARARFRNTIQTNLYSLNDERIALLRRFNSVGVSFDVFGDHRKTLAGRSSNRQVMENMDRLRAAGVRFGCISVMTPGVAENIARVYEFFSALGISFRVLPIYRTAFEDQHDGWSLTMAEVEETFKQLFDRMIDTDSDVIVSPLDGFLRNVVSLYGGVRTSRPYPRAQAAGERLFIVDTDGTVYASSDAYVPGYAYGNIFSQNVDALLDSDGYRRTRADRAARLETCRNCRFGAVCSGEYLGEATREQRQVGPDGQTRCPIARALHEHIDSRLRERGLVDAEQVAISLDRIAPYIRLDRPAQMV